MTDLEHSLRKALRDVELPEDLIARLRAIPDRQPAPDHAAEVEPHAADTTFAHRGRWPAHRALNRFMKPMIGMAAAAAVVALLVRFGFWEQQPPAISSAQARLQAGQSALLAADCASSPPAAPIVDLERVTLELATVNLYLDGWEALRLSEKAKSLSRSSRGLSPSPGFSDAASLSWVISTEMALDSGISKADATRDLQLLVQELPGSQGALRAESLLTQWKLQ